jgi:hypothetical protein
VIDTPSHERDIGLLKTLAAEAFNTSYAWGYRHQQQRRFEALCWARRDAIIAALEAQSPDALAAAERRGIERAAEVVVDHCRACNASGKEASFLDAVVAIRALGVGE